MFFYFRNGQKTYPSVIQRATVFVDSKEDCVKQWKIRNLIYISLIVRVIIFFKEDIFEYLVIAI